MYDLPSNFKILNMTHFIDHVFIDVASGDGGNGMVAWRREKYEPLGRPAGGNGGRGGHVFIEATADLSTLVDFRFKSKFEALPGQRGGPKSMHGKNANDLIIRVPIGTVIKDAASGEVIADLVANGQRVIVAEGGAGGRGNSMMASATRRAPHFCEPGQSGIKRRLELELKILADVGIIGLPNAGKSTLLSVVSAAKPKIADYPFSTLEPNLGVVQGRDRERAFVIADIPGLIEGASRGVGLGHDFLRHVERTRLLIHLVDASSQNLESDIAVIDRELALYSESLAKLPRILVLNKSDIVSSEELAAIAQKIKRSKNAKRYSPPMVISAATKQGVNELISKTLDGLAELSREAEEPPPKVLPPDAAAADHGDTNSFEIRRKKNVFTVTGDRVERLVAVTNMRDPESLFHLHHVLRAMGVIDALIAQGAAQGSEVNIGEMSFTFGEEWS